MNYRRRISEEPVPWDAFEVSLPNIRWIWLEKIETQKLDDHVLIIPLT